MNQHTYVAIMAGGVGSRFWPASRTALPKQFLDIMGVGKSLLRLTFERFLELVPAERIYIVTNEQYRDLVKEHLPELKDNQILGEPSRNNTAPCVAYTAFKLRELDPEANLIVAPSDHIVLKPNVFLDKVKTGLAFTAKKNAILTLGITPSRPDTGYGYIQYGDAVEGEVSKVIQFKEKPDADTAQVYLDSGEYLWNAGIFLFRCQTILDEFKAHAPEIYRILDQGCGTYNTDGEQAFVDKAYPTTPSISIDYAIMEPSQQVYTIPAEFGWSDLGTWASLFAESEKDEHENVLQGSVVGEDLKNNLIRLPKGKVGVIRGLENYIVVDTKDALLIYPKSEEQAIKAATQQLNTQGLGDFL